MMWVLTNGSLGVFKGPLIHDVPEHGQQEGYGFPAACLGDANEVSARHDCRDGLGLDRRGLLVAMPGNIWKQAINTMCPPTSI